MKKKLFLIHTFSKFNEAIINPFAKPFLDENPDIELLNISDDSLLIDTVKSGQVTIEVASRMLNYVKSAEIANADAVMITCTSVNDAIKYIRGFTNIPVFNIYDPVARAAVAAGKKIGVLGTLPTSPEPVIKILNEEAQRVNKKVEIVKRVVDGAYGILMEGNRKKHDEMVADALYKLGQEVDVITFAQVSMSLVPHDEISIPIFKSGKSGFEEAKKLLFS